MTISENIRLEIKAEAYRSCLDILNLRSFKIILIFEWACDSLKSNFFYKGGCEVSQRKWEVTSGVWANYVITKRIKIINCRKSQINPV